MSMPTEPPRRKRRRRLLLGVAALVVVAAAITVPRALRGDKEPTLLNESDFQGVREVVDGGGAPGWYSCIDGPYTKFRARVVATSRLLLPDYDIVGATLLEASPPLSTEDLLDDFRAQAAECAEFWDYHPSDDESALHRKSIVPLTDLDEGMVGWRIRDPSVNHGKGVWTENLAIPLDDTHLLRVGFETGNDEPPVPREELIRLALEGVERVGLDEEPEDG